MQNDPVNFVDPTGLNLENPAGKSRPDPLDGGVGIFSPGIHTWTFYTMVGREVGNTGNLQMIYSTRDPYTGVFVVGGSGGGGGGGTGGGQNLTPPNTGERVPLSGDSLTQYRNARDRLLELLRNKNSDCAKFLRDKLGLSGNRVARAVLGQRPFDGTLSTLSMADAGLNHRRTGILAERSVRDVFATYGPEAIQAFYATPDDRGARLTDVYYSPSGLYAGAILHETLHYFTGLNDEQLANRLGIDPALVREQGTRVISWAFRDAGCR